MKVINSSQDVLKVSKFKHFSDYEPEELTTNVDIHDYVTPDKKIVAESGIDILTLHDFAFLKKPIMLPCPYCGREQAFISRDGFINPMDRSIFKSENVRKRKKEKPSDIVHVDNEGADYVDYDFTNDIITIDLAYGDQYFDKNRLENEIAGKILDGIIKTAKDIRKDFVCSYDEDHHIFVEFTLTPVVDSVSSSFFGSIVFKKFKALIKNSLAPDISFSLNFCTPFCFNN